MHSRLASWIASNSEWFEDVATIVYFIDCHDTILLPEANNLMVCFINLNQMHSRLVYFIDRQDVATIVCLKSSSM